MSHNNVVISRQLREAGYRFTPQRQLILDAVCELGQQVTPDAVYEKVARIAPTLSRATVYRVLHFLTEQRILAMVQRGDGHYGYEIAGSEPHHHLVCRSCDESIALTHSALGAFHRTMESDSGFEIDESHVTFFGHCRDCRSASIT